MKLTKIKIGNIVRFITFHYTNTVGGTSTANQRPMTDLDAYFDGIAQGKVVHFFYDYECGYRIHVELDEKNWELIKDKASENKVYVSEFDLI